MNIDPADRDLQPDTEPGADGPRKISSLPLVALGALGLLSAFVLVAAAKFSASEGSDDSDERIVKSSRAAAQKMTAGFEAGVIPADGQPPRLGSGTDQQALAQALASATQAGDLPPLFVADETTQTGVLPVREDEPSAAGGLLPGVAGAAAPGSGTTPELLPPEEIVDRGAGSRGPSQPSARSELQERMDELRTTRFIEALQAEMPVSGWSPEVGPSGPGEAQDKIAKIHAELASLAKQGGTGGQSYMEKVAQLQALLPTASPEAGPSAAAPADPYAKFAGKAGRWELGNKLENPGSLYELRAGSTIPAVLNSHINSDLPGPFRATVTIDVRDTATGEHVLIPQGSRLLGYQASGVAFGQDGLLAAVQRIIFPDGRAIDLGAMPVADGSGQIGLRDLVNHHYLRIFTSALLMSGISGGIALSQDAMADDNNRVSLGGTMSQSLGNQLGQLSEEMIRKNLELAPTIEIRPGKVMSIEVQKDLTFDAPYRAFDYRAGITADGLRFPANH